jgi:hypothetical protein
MPHTNRRKKSTTTTTETTESKPKIVHTKRQQILDNDGWTHVVDTPSRRNAPKHNAPFLHGGDFERDGVSYINRTLDELKADYEYYKKQWEENTACEELKTKLQAREGKLEIKNVVCLGLGSLQSARREGRRASYTQLVALQSIIGTFSKELYLSFSANGANRLVIALGPGSLCIFQDPQFTELDTQFLESLGCTVVNDPLAFGHIADRSLVYAIHCYADIYKSISEAPSPAILVGTDVGNFGRFDL